MARREIKFGVIGLGLMGREFASAAARWLHLLNVDFVPKITAICDTNPKLFDWYESNIESIKIATTDYHDLLNSDDVEAIYCAVPHNLHAQMYSEIIRAGKHLLGEKPFGIDLAANEQILQVIAQNPKVFVACSSEFPFFPAVQRAVRYVKENRFGQVMEAACGLLHSSDLDPNKKINWKRMIDLNGEYGCMGDLGMHVLHVPLRLGWRPDSVTASLVKRVTTRPDGRGSRVPCDTWDNATITGHVPSADGAFPLVLKTWRIAPSESNTWSIRVLGMKGSALFTTKSPRQWQFMQYQPGGRQCWQVEDLGYQSLFPTITGGIFEFGFTDAIQQMWAAYVDELAGGTAGGFPCATPREAADHHAILTAALQAGTTGQAVPVAYGGPA